MKKTIFIILGSLILSLFVKTGSSALDLSSIIVYPVPLNPYKHSLKIEDRGVYKSLPAIKVKIEIFDINGDPLFSREYMGIGSIQWSGRNNNGKMVKPGLYIIKISVENLASGEFGQRIIRILVKY